MEVQYAVSDAFLEEEFVHTGRIGEKERSFTFDLEKVRPDQRELLLKVMTLEELRQGKPLRLLEYRNGRVGCDETLELDHEVKDAGGVFFYIQCWVNAAQRHGVVLLNTKGENGNGD